MEFTFRIEKMRSSNFPSKLTGPFLILLLVLVHTPAFAEKTLAIRKPPADSPSSAPKATSESEVFLVDKPQALENFPVAKIVGGTTAVRGEFPSFVQLWVDGSEIGGDFGTVYAFCGASLISNNKVLTAAHCTVDFSTGNLFALPEFYSFNDNISFSDLIPVSGKAVHPNYNASTTNSDVSVLTLSNPSGTPLTSVYGGSDQLAGDSATIVGTGALSEGGSGPATLQKVTIPVVSNSVCKSSYGSAAITGNMMCAGLSGGGKDSCQGDSGGPLWVKVNGKTTQTGIVSWGIGCARPTFYGVYARVSALISFITQNAPNATVVTDPSPPVPDNVPIVAPQNLLLLGHF